MLRSDALEEFKKMWTWLYQHPAHDKKYYGKHVVKLETPWRNNCPLCETSESETECKECLELWNKEGASLCTDPNSPYSQWRKTHLNDPNFRTWYAGQIADIAQKYIAKQ